MLSPLNRYPVTLISRQLSIASFALPVQCWMRNCYLRESSGLSFSKYVSKSWKKVTYFSGYSTLCVTTTFNKFQTIIILLSLCRLVSSTLQGTGQWALPVWRPRPFDTLSNHCLCWLRWSSICNINDRRLTCTHWISWLFNHCITSPQKFTKQWWCEWGKSGQGAATTLAYRVCHR